MAVLHVNEASFDKLLQSGQPVLVDFWAGWCGPCKMLAPVIEELDIRFQGDVTVAKVDVDDNSGLALRYNIQSIPTVVFFKDGAEAGRLVGVLPKDRFVEMAEKNLLA